MTTRCGFVALVGQPNAGKSTLLNALVDWPVAAVTPKPQTTQRLWRGIVTQQSCQTIWVDSPGQLDPVNALQTYMHDQYKKVFANCDVLVHVESLAKYLPEQCQRMQSQPEQLLQDVICADRPFFSGWDTKKPHLLVLNQIDRLPQKQVQQLAQRYQAAVGKKVPLCLLSARTGEGVKQLQRQINSCLPTGPFLFDADLITDASERLLTAECIRHQAMLQLRQELPYCVAVTIEQFNEKRRFDKHKPLVDITAIVHVQRTSQRAMVIGKNANRIKAIGTAARQTVQRLLDCPVMLRLLVRVQPNWTKEVGSLRKLGYTDS
ncbi:MAG: GTPase Era [Myxococcota bacterium]